MKPEAYAAMIIDALPHSLCIKVAGNSTGPVENAEQMERIVEEGRAAIVKAINRSLEEAKTLFFRERLESAIHKVLPLDHAKEQAIIRTLGAVKYVETYGESVHARRLQDEIVAAAAQLESQLQAYRVLVDAMSNDNGYQDGYEAGFQDGKRHGYPPIDNSQEEFMKGYQAGLEEGQVTGKPYGKEQE